jgi:hypothetical protein
LFGLLLVVYPLFLLIVSLVLWALTGIAWVWILWLVLPLLAQSYLHWKK